MKAFLSCCYYLVRGIHILGPECNRISDHLLYVLRLHALRCSPSFFLGNFIFILFCPVCHLATSKKGKLRPGYLLFQAPWPTSQLPSNIKHGSLPFFSIYKRMVHYNSLFCQLLRRIVKAQTKPEVWHRRQSLVCVSRNNVLPCRFSGLSSAYTQRLRSLFSINDAVALKLEIPRKVMKNVCVQGRLLPTQFSLIQYSLYFSRQFKFSGRAYMYSIGRWEFLPPSPPPPNNY